MAIPDNSSVDYDLNILYVSIQEVNIPSHKNAHTADRKSVVGIILAVFVIGLVTLIIYRYGRPTRRGEIIIDIPQKVTLNQETSVPIYIDTHGVVVNAAEVHLKFDPQVLQVKSVSKEGSFFTLWITDYPKFSNDNGTVSFAGGLPSPGIKGKSKIGSLTLLIKKPGLTSLIFLPTTRVLLNDGHGTALPLKLSPIRIQGQNNLN